MEILSRFIEVVDANVISCLIPAILTLIIIDYLFKCSAEAPKALNVIRWIIIGYSVLLIVNSSIGLMTLSNKTMFIARITGPYKFTYALMFLSATVLPLSLFLKKLGTNIYYVLLISCYIKIGVFQERGTILITSSHINNLSYWQNVKSMMIAGSFYLIQGFLIGLTLIIFQKLKR